MSFRFDKKELLILVSSILFLLAFILGGYFLFLTPKKQEMSNKELQLETEEQLLATIQTKKSGSGETTAEGVAELQKKVPVKQQLEQLILDLNKAEVISESFITNMSFSEGDVVAPIEESADSQTKSEDLDQAGEATSEITSEETISVSPLPDGIKKVNVNLSVTSPGYSELMLFLGELENLKRRVVIESVAFSGGTELTSGDQVNQDISYSITLSAFYMPGLEDLQDQLPELEVPAPSNKTNPFATSPDIIGETASE